MACVVVTIVPSLTIRSVYLALRFAKFVAVIVLFAGSVGAVLARDLADRRRFAFYLAGPGFGLTWLVGFALAAYLSVPFTSTFIVLALPLSLFSLQVVLYTVGREGRRTVTTAVLIVLPLLATLALMVWRPR